MIGPLGTSWAASVFWLVHPQPTGLVPPSSATGPGAWPDSSGPSVCASSHAASRSEPRACSALDGDSSERELSVDAIFSGDESRRIGSMEGG